MLTQRPKSGSISAAHLKLIPKRPAEQLTREEGEGISVSQVPWKSKKQPANTFPDQPMNGSVPPATIDNVRFLLEKNNISVRYNVIKKKTVIVVPGLAATFDNADAIAYKYVESLAALHGMPGQAVGSCAEAVADENAWNPVLDWIDSVEWDGVDRLPAFYATITVQDGYPDDFKCVLMHKWALSAVAAAALPSGFSNRGVLTLQGGQGVGKTSWVRKLISDPGLRASVIKVDHHMDASNKDSLITATSHWIVEIGELESSFKRDIARLKGFLTSDQDKVRRPYGRVDSEYPRRTVFVATVNASDFLVDDTGNSRFWTIATAAIDYNHTIDMQQLFAQLAVEYRNGEIWWLSRDEEQQLEALNDAHRVGSVIRDRLMEAIDFDVHEARKRPTYTPTALLEELGMERPTQGQVRECAAILREKIGNSSRINGSNVWKVLIRSGYGKSDSDGFKAPAKNFE